MADQQRAGLIAELLGRAGNAADQLYRNVVPTKGRMFLRGLMQDTTPVDESYFQPEDLDAMRQLVGVNEKLRADPRLTVGENHLKIIRGDDGKPQISGDMYKGAYGPKVSYDTYESAEALGTDPKVTERPKNQMGQFRYETGPDGNVVVSDRYDFNAYPKGQEPGIRQALIESLKSRGPGPLAGALGSRFIPSDGRHGYDVRVNLGNPSTWTR